LFKVAVRSRRKRIETREDRNVRVGLLGVGEHSEGRNSISGSADDKVRVPHPVPESTEFRPVQSALAPICIGLGRIKPQSRRRPPSPTPASPPTASLYRA